MPVICKSEFSKQFYVMGPIIIMIRQNFCRIRFVQDVSSKLFNVE